MVKFYIIGAALIATLAGPFLLRPKGETTAKGADSKVVIVTPHNESIRSEFSLAFNRYMKKKTGKNVHIDWRTPGTGTTEIERYISSEYRASFESYWTGSLKKKWSDSIGGGFNNRKLNPAETPAQDTPEQAARRAFLGSNIGVGVDLFFGGGAYPFDRFAQMGYLVDSGIRELHPEWFTDATIPAMVSGEVYYDPQMRWVGTCLSEFGICYNVDTLARLGIKEPPTTWEDLGKPEYLGQVALADPSKSGSVAKAFEMLIQQEIHKSIAAIEPRPDIQPKKQQEVAIQEGWKNGFNLIQRIAGNARYFTDSATKIPLDVAAGNAAAGMTIDFYGRTYNELLKDEKGKSRMQYVTPVGGSSTGVDPIGMFRGAPDPGMAKAFIEFVLSEEGQKIWAFKKGAPGGPVKTALRRPPVRKDFYKAENFVFSADPDVLPYERAGEFEYVPEWTASSFGAIRFSIRVVCLDTHDEMKKAWEALVKNNFPPQAMRVFHDVAFVSYQSATDAISPALASADKRREGKLAKQLGDAFRSNYRRAYELAIDQL
jgi:iron(III) transport system substrate-binding protein